MHVTQIKNGIMKHANSKNYPKCKEYYSWIPSTCICENGKYLKSLAINSKFVVDETIDVTDSVSANFLCTVSANFHRDCHIVLTVL